MIRRASVNLWIIVLITLFGALLRLYALGSSPLRGDEAFAVRYWAAPLPDLIDPVNGIAWKEPHPFGTFLLFGAWRSVAGNSELALRLLPALINLLGIPAMFVLAKRLLREDRLAQLAALLWAINPHLIYHSQDFRNYAIWAALSLIGVLALLRITEDRAPTRRDWLAYILLVTLTLYIFFFEAVLLLVHGAYVLLFRRQRLRGWIGAMIVVFLLSLPSVYQLTRIAGNGYGGSGTGGEVSALVALFPSQLLFGETGLISVLPLLLCLAGMLILWRSRRESAGLLALWLIIPALALLLISSRLSVFWARYLIVVTPALIVAICGIMTVTAWRSALRLAVIGAVALLSLQSLLVYYGPEYHKAPDWFELRDYLREVVKPDDLVIMSSLDPLTGNADPTFEWYYDAPAPVLTLPNPQIEIAPAIQQALSDHRAVWYVVSGADPRINDELLADGILISDDSSGRSFLVRQYRAKDIRADEIDHPLAVQIGGATLRGFSITGRSITGGKLTVLLYWDGVPNPALTTFVHLIGSPKPDGSPLWAQKDHPPVALGRDVYALDLVGVVAGEYQIEVGMYDPADNNRRVPIGDSDHLLLTTVRIR